MILLYTVSGDACPRAGLELLTPPNGKLMEDTPYFDIYGNTVWGATAMMLGELKEILKKLEGFENY